MKLILSFVLCFNFVSNGEKNVLEYILSAYSQAFPEQFNHSPKKGKEGKTGRKKDKSKVTIKKNTQNDDPKLISIFEILQNHGVNSFATVTDIDLEVQREIATVLGAEKNLGLVFLIDETLTQNIAVIRYQLFRQKFQIIIQYSGNLAKLYYNNMMKCIKCYVQDGKAWVAFNMKHDFGVLNESQIKDILKSDREFTLEYNDHFEDKRMYENDSKYDGYLYPARNEVDTLFAIEIEQITLFKDIAKIKKDTKHTKIEDTKRTRNVTDEEKRDIDIWDIPEHGSVISGMLDTEQKSKMINLIETWHQEIIQQNTPPLKVQEEEQIKINNEEQKEDQVRNPNKTKANEKKKKFGKSKMEQELNEEDIERLELKVNASYLLSESPCSASFYNSDLKGCHFGVLLKSKEPMSPDIAEQLQLIHLRLGNLNNLPMEVLSKYGVKRMYTIIEFETPLTLRTEPLPVSESIDLHFFKMITFDNIENYQRFFAAFHLKHMLIQVIGEIEKEVPEKPELQEIFEEPDENGNITTTDKDTIFKENGSIAKDWQTEIFIESNVNLLKDESLKKDNIRELVPKNVIISENEKVISIRFCLFRIDLNNFVRFNHFHYITETLAPSAVYDKGPEVTELLSEENGQASHSRQVSRNQNKSSSNSNFLTLNSNAKGLVKRRSYLIGIDYKQTLSLDFDFQIQACFKNLCKEHYAAGSNGLNNIFVLFEDTLKMKELVQDIREYNNEIQAEHWGEFYGNF